MPTRRTSPRDSILTAFHAAVGSVHPERAFHRYCRRHGDFLTVGDGEELDLKKYQRVWLVGAGKASHALASAAYRLLNDRVAGGSIALREAGGIQVPRVTVWHAGHPHPNATSVAAAEDALRVVRSSGADDLILCLLSGGASSLWAAPPEGVSLADLRRLTAALLRSGAPISELNTVRKHLSRVAGGRLAQSRRGAHILTLAVSDVIDAGLDMIGSGPTLPDTTTADEALDIIRGRNIDAPESILLYLRREAAGADEASSGIPSGGQPYGSFHVIASVSDAVDGAAKALAELGYSVRVVSRTLQGEASEVASMVVEAAIASRAAEEPTALLWGGETTVTVRGQGKGGRNQELALSAALHLRVYDGITVASLATDGSDGPTDAAGSFADSETVIRGVRLGGNAAQALRDNDSHTYLTTVGDVIVTGPTGTNVNDLVFAIID